MAALVQLVCSSQSGRAGTDDSHLFSGAYLWRLCICITMCIGIFYDPMLIFLCSDAISVVSTCTGSLTKGGADPGCKLRKIICLFQTLIGLFPITSVYQIVPFRYQIVQRTSTRHTHDRHSCLTEGYAAGHASCTLLFLFLQRERRMELAEIFYSFLRIDRFSGLSFIF